MRCLTYINTHTFTRSVHIDAWVLEDVFDRLVTLILPLLPLAAPLWFFLGTYAQTLTYEIV